MSDTPTETRKRKGRAFWAAHVEAWQNLGGSQSEYCRQHQLSERLFSMRKNKFANEDTDSVEFRFKIHLNYMSKIEIVIN